MNILSKCVCVCMHAHAPMFTKAICLLKDPWDDHKEVLFLKLSSTGKFLTLLVLTTSKLSMLKSRLHMQTE